MFLSHESHVSLMSESFVGLQTIERSGKGIKFSRLTPIFMFRRSAFLLGIVIQGQPGLRNLNLITLGYRPLKVVAGNRFVLLPSAHLGTSKTFLGRSGLAAHALTHRGLNWLTRVAPNSRA